MYSKNTPHLFAATLSFASTTTLTKSQRSVALAWKATTTNGVTQAHDINMVYGGKDLSPRHELVSTIAFA